MSKELQLIQSTIDTFLNHPAQRVAAEQAYRAAVPEDQQKNLDATLARVDSYRDGMVVQLAFAVASPGTDTTQRQPSGRSVSGGLGRFLKTRHIRGVDDAFQNIGKNQPNLVRNNNKAFDAFLTWAAKATPVELVPAFEHACAEVAKTERNVLQMPDLNLSKLSFAAVMSVYEDLFATPSKGAHEQFVIASLLDALVQQSGGGLRVQTKKLTASDQSSSTAGDILIYYGEHLKEAYELTANDWAGKLQGAQEKRKHYDLRRIHVVAPVGESYKAVTETLQGVPDDISVLDLHGFSASLLHSLSNSYRNTALVRLYELLDQYQTDSELINGYVRLLKAKNLTAY